MSVETIFAFLIASSLISLAPGPDNLFVLTQSALHGRKSGIMITLGLCTGLLFHTVAVATGLAAIFQASELAFNILKFVGAGYLLYLAWQAWRSSPADITQQKSNVPENALHKPIQNPLQNPLHKPFHNQPGALYRRGIIMNITNPKVSIFFLAFLPQFTNPQQGPLVWQFFTLGLLFIVVAFCLFSCIAVLSGSLGSWLRHSPQNQIYLNRVAAIVLIGLALKLISSSTAL